MKTFMGSLVWGWSVGASSKSSIDPPPSASTTIAPVFLFMMGIRATAFNAFHGLGLRIGLLTLGQCSEVYVLS